MKWISVTEKLPPIGIEVLCAERDGTVWLDFRNAHGWADKANGEYYAWWMPIPRVPKN